MVSHLNGQLKIMLMKRMEWNDELTFPDGGIILTVEYGTLYAYSD